MGPPPKWAPGHPHPKYGPEGDAHGPGVFMRGRLALLHESLVSSTGGTNFYSLHTKNPIQNSHGGQRALF